MIKISQISWKDCEKELTAIRQTVFVDEYAIPIELEIDEEDPKAVHFLAFVTTTPPLSLPIAAQQQSIVVHQKTLTTTGSKTKNEDDDANNIDGHHVTNKNVAEDKGVRSGDRNSTPVGTIRLLSQDGHIGRICVLKPYRGQGIATQMLQAAEEAALSQFGLQKVFLYAMVSVKDFYVKHGYKECGEVFMDAGIPHIEMIKKF